MTPRQFHYPLFFDHQVFSAILENHGLECREFRDTPDHHLLIAARNSPAQVAEIRIETYSFLMLQGPLLFVWKKYEDGLLIRQYDVDAPESWLQPKEVFIEIRKYACGKHSFPTDMAFHHFTTYIRKPNLPQPNGYEEQYVIVYIHEEQMYITPMEDFNATGGDPMYVWPVLASYDPERSIVFGTGMRMGAFEIELVKK